ncbi:hypothetical protein ACJRO7_004571 [Eucalyptus globulus]|uniref:Uncharacterized protein n=1 Tax=Eucalyptus globulus TaxID=34317 RepID=A0ABD3J0K9_EUCGL
MLTRQHQTSNNHDIGDGRKADDSENGVYFPAVSPPEAFLPVPARSTLRSIQLRMQIHEPQHAPHEGDGEGNPDQHDKSAQHPNMLAMKIGGRQNTQHETESHDMQGQDFHKVKPFTVDGSLQLINLVFKLSSARRHGESKEKKKNEEEEEEEEEEVEEDDGRERLNSKIWRTEHYQ